MNSCDADMTKRFKDPNVSWRISWSTSSRIVALLFAVSLLMPIIVIVCTLPTSEIPQSLAILASLTVMLALAIPVLMLLFVPHHIQHSRDGFIRIYSLGQLCLFACKVSEITSIRTIYFREYICLRSRGWPTDWSCAILISLRNSSSIALSVTDPHQFITDIKSI
jgi:hypothetical protein